MASRSVLVTGRSGSLALPSKTQALLRTKVMSIMGHGSWKAWFVIGSATADADGRVLPVPVSLSTLSRTVQVQAERDRWTFF